jgi:putative ATPase
VPTHLKDSSRDKEGFGHGQGYLYPHAYRDHWVAQQYLPPALQGRTFYQPSSQGYEESIAEEVARRREAQLAAMMEVQQQAEILTYHPGERDHDRWLQRTVSNAGERLGRLRDRVLDAARLQRHHVVLDLRAGSGLLTWEILRRAPEGGTWALAQDRERGEGLRQQAERLPRLQRPVVLVGEIKELADLLALRGEQDLRFDAVVGRNALGALADQAGALRHLASWLQPGGRLSLAETVVGGSQRLYELVDTSSLAEDLRRRLVEAEEAIYLQADDPLVSWQAADLGQAMEVAGFQEMAVEDEVLEDERLISTATLDRWFSDTEAGERPSYGQHLRRHLASSERAEVEALFRRQLAGQTVTWRTRIAYVRGVRP